MINLHLLPIYGDKYPSGILCYTYSSILAHSEPALSTGKRGPCPGPRASRGPALLEVTRLIKLS